MSGLIGFMGSTASVLGFGAVSWKTKAPQHLHRLGPAIRRRKLPFLLNGGGHLILPWVRVRQTAPPTGASCPLPAP